MGQKMEKVKANVKEMKRVEKKYFKNRSRSPVVRKKTWRGKPKNLGTSPKNLGFFKSTPLEVIRLSSVHINH